eukprot:3165101-Rhodomonas_salina.1
MEEHWQLNGTVAPYALCYAMSGTDLPYRATTRHFSRLHGHSAPFSLIAPLPENLLSCIPGVGVGGSGVSTWDDRVLTYVGAWEQVAVQGYVGDRSTLDPVPVRAVYQHVRPVPELTARLSPSLSPSLPLSLPSLQILSIVEVIALADGRVPVSYTHLTLPTICSV